MIKKPMLTTAELADFLKVSVASIEKARNLKPENHPPFFRIGRSVRYRWDDIERWLESRMNDSASQNSDNT